MKSLSILKRRLKVDRSDVLVTTVTAVSKTRHSFANHELVTLAVYLLGGKTSYVDTEDVAVKANEIAPGRFTWRKYPDQVNIENVRAFLSDAKKSKNGNYLIGAGKRGWMLTESGLVFAEGAVKKLEYVDVSVRPETARERKWRQGERLRMLSSEAFEQIKTHGASSVTLRQAEEFFHLDDYVLGEARQRKLARTVNTFRNDPDLGPVVHAIAQVLREGEKNGKSE